MMCCNTGVEKPADGADQIKNLVDGNKNNLIVQKRLYFN